MDTKEVLLLLSLIIAVLKDLVQWIQGNPVPDPVLDHLQVSGLTPEGIAAVARWFVI